MSPRRTILRWLSALQVKRRKSGWASWPVREIASEWPESGAEWGAPAPKADAWFEGSVTGATGPFVRLRPDSAPAAEPTLLGLPMRFVDRAELGAPIDLDGLLNDSSRESVHVRLAHCSWSSRWLWRPGPSPLFRSFRFRRLVRRAIRALPGVQSVTVDRRNVILVNVTATSFESNRAIAEAVHAAMVAAGGWVNHCLIVGEAALKEPADLGGNEEEKG